MLKRGGNAIDAAVATGFALAVTLPRAGNIGGGGFMLVHLAESDEQVFIDYREMAPDRASRDMFLNEDGTGTSRWPTTVSVRLVFRARWLDDSCTGKVRLTRP